MFGYELALYLNQKSPVWSEVNFYFFTNFRLLFYDFFVFVKLFFNLFYPAFSSFFYGNLNKLIFWYIHEFFFYIFYLFFIYSCIFLFFVIFSFFYYCRPKILICEKLPYDIYCWFIISRPQCVNSCFKLFSC